MYVCMYVHFQKWSKFSIFSHQRRQQAQAPPKYAPALHDGFAAVFIIFFPNFWGKGWVPGVDDGTVG